MAFEDLITTTALAAHFAAVRAGSSAAGTDGLRPDDVARDLERHLGRLSAALGDSSWRPAPLLRIHGRKPGGGVRRLAIPTVADRIVIAFLRHLIAPAVEPLLGPSAHAYRPGRSARGAVDAVLAAIRGGARFVALADLRDFFDSVALAPLHEAVAALPVPRQACEIARRLLDGHALAPGRGLAQGSALSPALSNLALVPLDRALTESGRALVRYCDNLCMPAATEAEARRALAVMRTEAGRLDLRLKEQASQAVAVGGGFLWLGFWIGAGGLSVSEGAVAALRSRLFAAAHGDSGLALRERLEPIVRGWAQYFNAPLPEGVSLGEHDSLVRELLAPPIAPALELPPVVADEDGEPPWWEATAGAPDEVAALLDEADQLAAAGDFAGAETAYAAAERAIPRQPPPDTAPTTVPWEDEAIDGFLGLFAAGQERCDIAPDRVRERFETLGQPPGTKQARDHLDGNIALAVRPLLADGTTTLGVVDVDARTPAAAVASAAHAGALASVVRAWRIEGLLETTGGRGHHLWIPVDGRMPADTMASFLDHLGRTAGTPPTGVTVERLPAGAGSPDLHAQTITLPLGLHAETGVPSSLAWLDGPAVVADGAGGIAGLFARRPSTPDAIAAHALGATSPDAVAPDPPAGSPAADAGLARLGRPIERVLAGCVLLRHLEAKAAASGHLSHAERLSLLYSLGHVAEGGQRAIHAIIGRCANYDPAETDRQIAKLTGLPIGCTRLREKHATPELLPQCNCDFGDVRRRGGYPTPLLHAAGFRRSGRDVLRGRQEGAMAVRERHQREPAAVAIPVATPHDVDGGRDLDVDGGVALATPPHEWA